MLGPARVAIPSFVLALVLAAVACGDDDTPPAAGTSSGTSGTGGTSSGGTSGGGTSGGGTSGGTSGGLTDAGNDGNASDAPLGTFTVTSTAYVQGAMIPQKHECQSNGPGQNISPPLAWTGAPAGTQSYAIVMRDKDFQNGFVHWVIWDIPSSVTTLAEGVEHVATPATPAGAKQANFNGSIIGYQGPCSPSSVNTYEITVYAIPTATLGGITTSTSKNDAAAAIVSAATAVAMIAGES